MSRLPTLTARDVIAKIRKAGFHFDRHAKGSHEIWFNPGTLRWVTVPHHPGDLHRRTIAAILKEAGLSRNDFLRL